MTDLNRLAEALKDRYTLERELGQGGMATVYLAHDLKHDRKVAIKVLRPELAAVLGAERFVQEIKTTANLQHPNILPLFDSGEADGFLYYVMPYVEGETLRAKLNRETQLGVEEAVKLTTEVADALDYAHGQNVIHRDIKPENILLHAGRPLVADFGIALAVSAAAGGRMTETGLSLGTPHYMSPEQATADKQITARSDIYSLGAVLYEMLTGEPPHTGSSAQAIILKIVGEEVVPVTRLRKAVPANVAGAVAKALEKLPADRFESAKAFAEALNSSAPAAAWTGVPSRATRAARRGAMAGWIVGAVGLVLAGWAMISSRGPRVDSTEVRYLNITLPDSAPLAFIGEGTLGVGHRSLDLSADGKQLVYVGGGRGQEQLYLRALDSRVVTPIAGTDGAYQPFFSPDGLWVGYFVGAEMRKVPVAGGASVPLATVPEEDGAVWVDDERILVSLREGSSLGWVPTSGGTVDLIPSPRGAGHLTPHLLPGGRHALVATWNTAIWSFIGVTDLETGRTLALTMDGPQPADSVDRSAVFEGAQPTFVEPGYLVYSARAGLMVAAFDPAEFRLLSRPVEALAGVRRGPEFAQYLVGPDGTLFYGEGGRGNVGAFVWTARDGSVDSLGFPPQEYGTFALSPDGRRLVTMVFPGTGPAEVWVYDLEMETTAKIVTRGVPAEVRWWPDGRHVVYTEASSRPPYSTVTVKQLVESAGERDTLGTDWHVSDIAPGATHAAGVRSDRDGGAWIFPLAIDGEPVAIDTFPSAWGPAFSGDGRWIAYTSNESGQYEVYVAPSDRRGERQKISLAGGEEPLWSPRTGELIYRWGQRWYAVTVPANGVMVFGRPREILSGPYVNVGGRSHDLSPDGRRHLLILGPLEQTIHHLNVITNWKTQLAQRVGR